MASDLLIDGEARPLSITLLCGVQKSPSQPGGRSQHSTPHFRRRHIMHHWGIHLTGVGRRLGRWNVPMPAPTTLSLLGSFRLGSRLMQTAWTTWNGCDGLAASSARPVVIREDGGLGTAGSCVLDAVAAHQ